MLGIPLRYIGIVDQIPSSLMKMPIFEWHTRGLVVTLGMDTR